MIKKWKFINRISVLDHPRMKLVEDIVELPNGEQTSYLRYAPATKHSVAVIALNTESKILVQREYSYPPNQVMYQLPGGDMELDESPEAAAVRELAEESGLTASDCQVIGAFYPLNRRSDQKQYVVVCRNLSEHKLQEDPEEFIEINWLSGEEITSLIRKGEVDNINLLAALHLFDVSK